MISIVSITNRNINQKDNTCTLFLQKIIYLMLFYDVVKNISHMKNGHHCGGKTPCSACLCVCVLGGGGVHPQVAEKPCYLDGHAT